MSAKNKSEEGSRFGAVADKSGGWRRKILRVIPAIVAHVSMRKPERGLWYT